VSLEVFHSIVLPCHVFFSNQLVNLLVAGLAHGHRDPQSRDEETFLHPFLAVHGAWDQVVPGDVASFPVAEAAGAVTHDRTSDSRRSKG